MAIYETMLILDTQNEPQVIEEELDKITGFLESGGGSMHLVEKVGRRRLAYDIAGRSDGYYAVLYYETDPAQIAPLQRSLKLNESVLRHMVIRREKLPDGPMMMPAEPLRPRTEVRPAAPAPEAVATTATAAPPEEAKVEEESAAPVAPDENTQAESQPEGTEASPAEPADDAAEEKPE